MGAARTWGGVRGGPSGSLSAERSTLSSQSLPFTFVRTCRRRVGVSFSVVLLLLLMMMMMMMMLLFVECCDRWRSCSFGKGCVFALLAQGRFAVAKRRAVAVPLLRCCCCRKVCCRVPPTLTPDASCPHSRRILLKTAGNPSHANLLPRSRPQTHLGIVQKALEDAPMAVAAYAQLVADMA
eukprot:3578680-Rhodomonas_salina.1